VSDHTIGEKNEVLSHFSVPRETVDKLERYVKLLQRWNKSINLVAESTIFHVWSRHVLDSAQLLKFIPPSARTLVDLGSGAGFPGLVLAIMGPHKVHLIESIGKKASFLRLVAEDLELDATIHQQRIEFVRGLKADVITARALKPLPELLGLAKPLMAENAICLFLKGQKANAELTEAQKYWTFVCEKIPSLSDPSGTVLKISQLKEKHPYGSRRLPRKRKR
jgi:16S rRNA (guanine527-N7)-methyltransferase